MRAALEVIAEALADYVCPGKHTTNEIHAVNGVWGVSLSCDGVEYTRSVWPLSKVVESASGDLNESVNRWVSLSNEQHMAPKRPQAVLKALEAAGYGVLPLDGPHLLDMKDDGWSMEHPLRCRVEGHLLDCTYMELTRDAAREERLPSIGRRYTLRTVETDDGSMLDWMEVR